MVTVYRAFGLSVVIFVDDHEPAHVHVFGDGQAKINLTGADGNPELIWADGMKTQRYSPCDENDSRATGPFADQMERNPWLN